MKLEMYNATVEVALRKIDNDGIDLVMKRLAQHHPGLGASPRGWLDATISLPAESLAQATVTAVAVISSAYGAAAIACEVMTETERDARDTFVPLPELISVAEAAEVLGVSRQRVLQRINDRTLPATRVGRDYAIPRTAVEGAGS